MSCVKLDRIPRNGYCCPRCYMEDEKFSKLKFTVSNHFEVKNLSLNISLFVQTGCTQKISFSFKIN
jgi:hypothetical protein